MAKNRPSIDETKYHFEFTHQKLSEMTPSTHSSHYTLRVLKQMFPDSVPFNVRRDLPNGRKTTCEVFDAKQFAAWIDKVRVTPKDDAEAIQAVRAERPKAIVKAEAICSLFDNFSRKTGAIKAKGRAMQALWHRLYKQGKAAATPIEAVGT